VPNVENPNCGFALQRSKHSRLECDLSYFSNKAHARRKFTDTLKALPEAQREKAVVAQEGLASCNQLHAIIRKLKEASDQERYQARLEQSTPILEAFSVWLKTQASRVLPKSTLGQTIQYCRNQLLISTIT
jgi:transposase